MNAKTLIAAAALAIVGASAFADEVRDYPTPSTLTRAEVQADLAQARAQKKVVTSYGDVQASLVAPKAASTVVARDNVQRDAVVFHASAATTGEAYGTVEPGLNLRTRQEVRNEVLAAARGR